MKSEFKVRIFQPIVQEYRVALHEGLARRYGDRIDLWAAAVRNGERSVPLCLMRHRYECSFVKIGPVQWQRKLSLRGLRKGDVIVVCGDIHQISTLWIAMKARCCGIKVVWWGHHVSAQSRDSHVRIRLWIAKRLADIVLCYTDEGIRYLEQKGFPKGRVFATGNTLDLDSVECACKSWDGVRKFGDDKTILFCGVMREKVRVDILLHALAKLKVRGTSCRCIIVGAGDKKDDWEKLSAELGLSDSVVWVGELRGQDKLAPWFLSSDLFVYPGRIGLSLIHAFSFGLPVIVNGNANNHGPEYVAFKSGVNGWVFQENDSDDLAAVIESALFDSTARAKGLAGRDYVFENYSMTRMVERFSEALEAAAKL